MEERAKIPVLLPHANPTQSYWQEPPADIADLRTTGSLPESVDVVIIGSGISGAAVAWNLLQSGGQRNIVMLEARQACSGATGRNGGHTKAASYRSYLHNVEKYDQDMAVKIAQLELDNIYATHAFAREHEIDCESNPCITLDVVYDKDQFKLDEGAVAALKRAAPHNSLSDYDVLSPDQVRDHHFCGKGGREDVAGGITYSAGTISAYAFATGVLKLCLERGLNLQTSTPAVSLEQLEGEAWNVRTPRGSIVARRVVMATNGYTAYLLKQFQGIIVPLRGHVTAQRPGVAMPEQGDSSYSFVYKEGYEYMIQRPPWSRFNKGDIIIGGGAGTLPDGGISEYGITDDSASNEKIEDYLRGCLPRYFGDNWGGDHADGRIIKEWTGIMGYSVDHLPFVGQVPGAKNLWMSCSFQGHGMVMCWLCAKALVAMMDGEDGDELRKWFPDVFRTSEERMRQTWPE